MPQFELWLTLYKHLQLGFWFFTLFSCKFALLFCSYLHKCKFLKFFDNEASISIQNTTSRLSLGSFWEIGFFTDQAHSVWLCFFTWLFFFFHCCSIEHVQYLCCWNKIFFLANSSTTSPHEYISLIIKYTPSFVHGTKKIWE